MVASFSADDVIWVHILVLMTSHGVMFSADDVTWVYILVLMTSHGCILCTHVTSSALNNNTMMIQHQVPFGVIFMFTLWCV